MDAEQKVDMSTWTAEGPPPALGSEVMHVKSRSKYKLIAYAINEADNSRVVVYRAENGIVWVRAYQVMFDGRFIWPKFDYSKAPLRPVGTEQRVADRRSGTDRRDFPEWGAT